MRRSLVCDAFLETAAEETQLGEHAPSTFQPPHSRALHTSLHPTPVFGSDRFDGPVPLPSGQQDESLDKRPEDADVPAGRRP